MDKKLQFFERETKISDRVDMGVQNFIFCRYFFLKPNWGDCMVRSRLVSDYTFQLVFITDRLQPHSTVYRRRPSFSSRRCSCLVGTVFLNTSAPSVAVFRSRPQKTHPLVSNPYVQCRRSDAHVAMDTLIVSVTYLLTLMDAPAQRMTQCVATMAECSVL